MRRCAVGIGIRMGPSRACKGLLRSRAFVASSEVLSDADEAAKCGVPNAWRGANHAMARSGAATSVAGAVLCVLEVLGANCRGTGSRGCKVWRR